MRASRIINIEGDTLHLECGIQVRCSPEYLKKHEPQPGGYYGLDPDGDESYFPDKPEKYNTPLSEAETASAAGVEDVNLRATALNMAMQGASGRNPNEILKQAEKYFAFMKTGALPDNGSVQPIKKN